MPFAEGRTRAFVTCFEKKLKCDREIPCLNCVKRKLSCLYSHVEKPRKTPQRNAKRIKEMETRLQAMEELMKSTVEADDQGPSKLMPTELLATSDPGLPDEGMQNQLDDSDTAFSLNRSDARSLAAQWKLIKYQGPSRPLVKRPLPSMEEALSLLQEYFETFNTLFPLFNEDEFMQRTDWDYSAEPLADVAWWAALNVALAIGCRLRGMRTLQATELSRKAYGYMQNALNVTQDLTLRKPDLLGVQALLGIAIVLQETPNSRPASIIVAAAVKLTQNLNLHRQSSLIGLNEQQVEQCKRVFWIGYMLDKDCSLQLSYPPVQTDSECDVDLPAEYPDDGLGMIALISGQAAINIFRLRIQLAIIQSEIYTTLYSVQASKLSPSARALAIENLDNRLNAWKNGVDLDFGPGNLSKAVAPGAIFHIVILYMAYFNCLTMIHSVSFRGDYWTASASNTIERTLAGDPVSSRRTLCLPAARLAVRLVSVIPRGDYACIWLVLHHYVSAVVILLANIIQHPQDQSANTDMALVEPLLRLLKSLSIADSMEGGEDLHSLQEFSLSLEHKARTALENVHHALTQPSSLPASLPVSPEPHS
jgi:hypothetical protein